MGFLLNALSLATKSINIIDYISAIMSSKSSTTVSKAGKHLRRAALYSAAIATSIMATPSATSDLDFHRRSLIRVAVPQQQVDLRTTRERLLDEARIVAEESLTKTRHYDLPALIKIEKQWFSYLKNTDAPLEPFATSLMPQINKTGKVIGVDPQEIKSIAMHESALWPYAVGPGSCPALGIMQLNPCAHPLTKKQYAAIFVPETNFLLGGQVYKEDKKKFHNDVKKSLWAYYAGPGEVRGRPPKSFERYYEHVKSHMPAPSTLRK